MYIILFYLLFLWPMPLYAGVIGHAFTEQNTPQTTVSGSYVDVTGASIASSNFTTGNKYLIFITAQVNENSSGVIQVQTLHGSTAFPNNESQQIFATSTNYNYYQYQTVWTAVASEGIKLQFLVTAGTGTIDQIAMFAMDLTSELTENTDWCFGESATDQALTTGDSAGGSCSLTPATANRAAMVSTYAVIDYTDTTTAAISKMDRSGEATSSLPTARSTAISGLETRPFLMVRPFTVNAAANTFKEISTASASAHTRLHSSVFVLDLTKFRNVATSYTEADSSTLSTTDYSTQLQTTTITPSAVSDVFIVTYWGADRNNTSRLVESRIQVDNSDQPSGQTTDNYQLRAAASSATDEDAMPQATMVTSMTAAAHTIDLDASVDSATGSPTGQEASIIAFSMELRQRPMFPIFLNP